MTEITIPIQLLHDEDLELLGITKFTFDPRLLGRTTSVTEHTNLMDIDAMKILGLKPGSKTAIPENAQVNVWYIEPFCRYMKNGKCKIYEDMPLAHAVFTHSVSVGRAIPAYRIWFPTIEFTNGTQMHDITGDELYKRLVHLLRYGDTGKKIYLPGGQSTV